MTREIPSFIYVAMVTFSFRKPWVSNSEECVVKLNEARFCLEEMKNRVVASKMYIWEKNSKRTNAIVDALNSANEDCVKMTNIGLNDAKNMVEMGPLLMT